MGREGAGAGRALTPGLPKRGKGARECGGGVRVAASAGTRLSKEGVERGRGCDVQELIPRRARERFVVDFMHLTADPPGSPHSPAHLGAVPPSDSVERAGKSWCGPGEGRRRVRGPQEPARRRGIGPRAGRLRISLSLGKGEGVKGVLPSQAIFRDHPLGASTRPAEVRNSV